MPVLTLKKIYQIN